MCGNTRAHHTNQSGAGVLERLQSRTGDRERGGESETEGESEREKENSQPTPKQELQHFTAIGSIGKPPSSANSLDAKGFRESTRFTMSTESESPNLCELLLCVFLC